MPDNWSETRASLGMVGPPSTPTWSPWVRGERVVGESLRGRWRRRNHQCLTRRTGQAGNHPARSR